MKATTRAAQSEHQRPLLQPRISQQEMAIAEKLSFEHSNLLLDSCKEPSVGLYFVKQHIKLTVPKLVQLSQDSLALAKTVQYEVQDANEAADYIKEIADIQSISTIIASLQELGSLLDQHEFGAAMVNNEGNNSSSGITSSSSDTLLEGGGNSSSSSSSSSSLFKSLSSDIASSSSSNNTNTLSSIDKKNRKLLSDDEESEDDALP